MNQAEIIAALNAVRSAGHEFTKSFNHLSDIIETMAAENESLHAIVKRKDEVIAQHHQTIITKQSEAKADLGRAEVELAELRPMRQQRDNLLADILARNNTILDLRGEVSKLLEIILNVATSVDGVVNKPKADDITRSEPGLVTFGTSPPNTTQQVIVQASWESAQERKRLGEEVAYSYPCSAA